MQIHLSFIAIWLRFIFIFVDNQKLNAQIEKNAVDLREIELLAGLVDERASRINLQSQMISSTDTKLFKGDGGNLIVLNSGREDSFTR